MKAGLTDFSIFCAGLLALSLPLPPTYPISNVLLLSSFYRQGDQSSEKSNNLVHI